MKDLYFLSNIFILLHFSKRNNTKRRRGDFNAMWWVWSSSRDDLRRQTLLKNYVRKAIWNNSTAERRETLNECSAYIKKNWKKINQRNVKCINFHFYWRQQRIEAEKKLVFISNLSEKWWFLEFINSFSFGGDFWPFAKIRADLSFEKFMKNKTMTTDKLLIIIVTKRQWKNSKKNKSRVVMIVCQVLDWTS